MSEEQPELRRAMFGEFLGTFLLVLFGTGAVASAVLTGALTGLWQVAAVWWLGVAIAIHCSAPLSGAHLNPAVSLAFLLWRKFPGGRFIPYVAAQLAGAVAAGFTVAGAYWPALERFEAAHGIARGAPGSQLSAMVFGEYFPNPAIFGTGEAARALVSPLHAAVVEGCGTAVLVFVIFALTAPRNRLAPPGALVPLLIGGTVAALMCLFAPLTQAGWNPARDFGPRLVAFALGWGPIALPGPDGGFWVYILGPLVGGSLGGLAWRLSGLEEELRERAPVPPAAGREHAARERGTSPRATRDSDHLPKQRVLFICTHNSARSQMAEGWLRHLARDRFEVHSAGTEPGTVRPLAVRAMAEAGVDLSRHASKWLDVYLALEWDGVITVCDQAQEACPIFPGGRMRLHWSFPDPSLAQGTEEEQLEFYREVRDRIRAQVDAFIRSGESTDR